MEFIDFLKYGAIGISMALAILSYRLLSKEQEKDIERLAILKSIKNFFFVAVFLSVFFGILEFAGQFLTKQNAGEDEALNRIWKEHLSGYPDSTTDQRASRIASMLTQKQGKIDTTEICAVQIEELKALRDKITRYDNGFYENIVKLKNRLRQDPDGWTNLEHNIESKTDIFKIIKNIFLSLGHNYENLTNEEMVAKWKKHKETYTSKDLNYVFDSDINNLVRQYLDTFGNR